MQPDVEVKPDRAALLAGRDAVIDAAVNWILAQELNLAQDGVHRD